MNAPTVLGFTRKQLFDYFVLTIDLLYEKEQVDVDQPKYKYENFFNDSSYITPLVGGGASEYYSAQSSKSWFDPDRDITDSLRVLEKEPVYQALSKSSSIKSAFDTYKKLPVPEGSGNDCNESALGSDFVERLKSSGKSDLVAGYIDGLKRLRFQYLDFSRFCGYVALNYSVYLFDTENLINMRKNQKTPVQIRDALLGVKPRFASKNTSFNGPLIKMIDLIESGHGLVDSSQNMELLNLLKKLGLQAYGASAGQRSPNQILDKRFHMPKKRFVLRIGSRICSEFKYYDEKRSLVELMAYHLLIPITLVSGTKTERNIEDRKQVSRYMQPLYEHRAAVLRSKEADFVPLLDPSQ